MPQSSHSRGAAQKLAATNSRSFRTFLLVSQFAAIEIGARIRLARDEKGLSQEQLAALCSFSKRSLQDYEAGVTIPYKHFDEIVRILGHSTAWFLYGDESKAEDPEAIRQAIREEMIELAASVRRIEAHLGLDDPPPGEDES